MLFWFLFFDEGVENMKNDNKSSTGSKVAAAGALTVYGGARVISSLVKPYMGGKKRRRRRRKRW